MLYYTDKWSDVQLFFYKKDFSDNYFILESRKRFEEKF
jgi:hypothetical protein